MKIYLDVCCLNRPFDDQAQQRVHLEAEALVDALGVIDAIRFIQHFHPGYGDYTKERHQWLDKLTMGDFLAEMRWHQEADSHP